MTEYTVPKGRYKVYGSITTNGITERFERDATPEECEGLDNQKGSSPMMGPVCDCIVFDAEKNLDSHKAMSGSVYTIVADGNYIVDRKGKRTEGFFKAGDILQIPDVVMNENCGVFYAALKGNKK